MNTESSSAFAWLLVSSESSAASLAISSVGGPSETGWDEIARPRDLFDNEHIAEGKEFKAPRNDSIAEKKAGAGACSPAKDLHHAACAARHPG